MANKVKEYHKLPGSKKGFLIGKYSLWQGADHLLHIFSRFGIEDYKRFYFSDIQAVITCKTIVGKVQNIILGCLILLFLLPAYIFDSNWSIFYGIVSAVMFIFLLFNLYRGPTCETRLMTAVQTEKLQSLHRLKTTFRVMNRLRPQIQQIQGTLSREDLNEMSIRPAGSRALQGHGQPDASPVEAAKHENGRAHMILFALLLIDGTLVTSEFFISHVVPTLLSSVASLCIGIFVIIALVRQHNSDLPGSLRTITWTTLGFVCVTFVVGYIVGMVFAFRNPSIAYNQWEILKAISNLSPWDSPLKLSYNILVLCGAFFLGIPGLIIHQRSESWGKKLATSASNSSRPAVVSRAPEPG
ncbi:hypothetical protein D1BOALGB6SA_9332 [Olavius sp. associated proteobacterium Delta 1]|nr:hypothetical protein D1BOALGB6SA_9332 [Olavius sp. associated proteobacterium Delta 1]